MNKLAAAMMFLASSGGALAQSAVPAPAPAKPAKPAREEKICQRLVPTGSMLPVKTCRTRKQWEEMTRRSQGGLTDLKTRSDSTFGQVPD